MSLDLASYWKTVTAEVDASLTRTTGCLHAAAVANGFVPTRESFVHSRWLLLIPTRHEWRIGIDGDDRSARFSVRFGLRPGSAYYLVILGLFAAAIALGPLMIHWPAYRGLIGVCMTGLFLWPVAHAFVTRWQASRLETRLWRAVAELGPWRSSRIIMRSLIGYAPDAVIENRDLAAGCKETASG